MPTDIRLVIALIAATTSVSVATLTYLYKLLTDIADRRRQHRMNIMRLRNEIFVNQRIAAVIQEHTRTLAFRFSDSAWNSVDTCNLFADNSDGGNS